MFQYFYNQTLRKLTLAFGGLFDEIYISKDTSDGKIERTRVPLTYSGKEKFIRRINEASSISSNVKIETLLPKMAFEMTTLQYDPTRKINKINKKFKSSLVNGETYTQQAYSEVPYNVQFSLYCFTRTVDDNLQIMEQILPYFSPEFIVTLKMNEVDTNVDVPIILNTTNMTEQYEGDMTTRRSVISSFSFTAKAHIFSRVSGFGIIKEIDVNVLEDNTL
jgi:T4-like virus Myoviridae tail sheath stabiliser